MLSQVIKCACDDFGAFCFSSLNSLDNSEDIHLPIKEKSSKVVSLLVENPLGWGLKYSLALQTPHPSISR